MTNYDLRITIFDLRFMRNYLLFLLVSFRAVAQVPADAVFWNGPIYTQQKNGYKVEALAIQGEHIVFVGTKTQAKAWVGPNTHIVDLKGKALLPGLTDAHVHPVTGGISLAECDLTGLEQGDTILARLSDFAQKHPEKLWIRGESLWLPVFNNGNPHKSLLDRIIPDRPVFISTADGHSAWVNSKALALAGVTSATPDPEHGRIERDAVTGEPTGTLREDAMDLVAKFIPPYTDKDRVEGLRRALRMANSLGITTLVEASASREIAEAYLALEASGELTAHVNVSLYGDVSKGTEGAKAVIALNESFKNRGREIRFGQVKLFMDGVVEGKTAAMLEDYHHDHHAGIANAHPDTAKAMVQALDRAGLQIHIHAIGDRGIRMSLDALEAARRQNGIRDARHHIAHLHVVHPDDIKRFRSLGVTANFQALWATLEDTYMTDLNFPYLGKKRSEWQYPIGTMAKSGAQLAFGSDWPVSTMNPFMAAQVAITRRGPDATPRKAWTPQHLTDIQTVLRGYTYGGARLTFREASTGTLEVGKLADLIVLDRDPYKISKFQVLDTKVLMTFFKGKLVWGE